MSELWIAETKDWTGTQNQETRMRKATPTELLSAVRELDGVEEDTTSPDNRGRPWLLMAVDKPGRYLIILIEETE